MLRIATLAVLTVLIFSPGCARYQYSVVQPAAMAQEIPVRGNTLVSQQPLEYSLFDHGDSLGVRIDNPSDDPVLIIGERSYVVDPDGATHQMIGGTIAPRSFIAFRLPPAVRVYRSGPQFGVGMGVGSGRGGTFFGTGVGTTWGGHPASYGDSITTMRTWRWTTGDVRMHIVYEHGVDRFDHDFIVRRERVN